MDRCAICGDVGTVVTVYDRDANGNAHCPTCNPHRFMSIDVETVEYEDEMFNLLTEGF